MAKTALITGASFGIGLELAKLFAKDGHNLVLVACCPNKLNRLAEELTSCHGVEVKVIVQDLLEKKAPYEIYEQLENENIPIDYLINNAEISSRYRESAQNDHESDDIIEINMKPLTILTELFLPHMIEHRYGGILNVSLTAAVQSGHQMSHYYASKAYILSYTEALECELDGTGVIVSALCPGPMNTEFNQEHLIESRLFQQGVMDVEKVTLLGYQEFFKGKTIVIPGTFNRLLSTGYRVEGCKGMTRSVYKYKNSRKEE